MSKPVFAPDLIRMHHQNEKIVMVTAYDFTFASLLDKAGVDVLLVGDSLASVMQGKETTLSVTLDEIIYHSRLVASAAKHALVVADMPFMSYQLGAKEALESAGRIIKESGAGAVKLEGGKPAACQAIAAIVEAGIPVMGHVGLTPQSYHQMGGHKVQGKTLEDADRVLEEALRVQEAGAFSLVLEGIPATLAARITEVLDIPTIGIGAGIGCAGQVLVMHDLLGLFPGEDVAPPKFVKRYAELGNEVLKAVQAFTADVRASRFPDKEHEYLASSPQLRRIKTAR